MKCHENAIGGISILVTESHCVIKRAMIKKQGKEYKYTKYTTKYIKI